VRALDLCALYLPCSRGDAHFFEITKDYGGIGTTCGYLPAWMLWRLGCRDPRLVNRSEPSAGLVYTVGRNISAIVNGGTALGAWRLYQAGRAEPAPGDILYFGVVSPTGGISREHVAVLKSFPSGGAGSLVTYDLGHSVQPEGSESLRTLAVNGDVQFLGSTRKLVGFVSLFAVPFTAEADLTDHTLANA
jgi:hypothetical protein